MELREVGLWMAPRALGIGDVLLGEIVGGGRGGKGPKGGPLAFKGLGEEAAPVR